MDNLVRSPYLVGNIEERQILGIHTTYALEFLASTIGRSGHLWERPKFSSGRPMMMMTGSNRVRSFVLLFYNDWSA